MVTPLGQDLDAAVNKVAWKMELVASIQDGGHQLTRQAHSAQLVYAIRTLEQAQAGSRGRGPA